MAGQPVRRRKATRARHIDYAAAGAYFVTVCAADRACIFGEVTTLDEVRLSAIGEVIARTLTALPARWDGVVLDAYVVMPNHVHAIIWLGQGDDARASTVGAGGVSAVGAGLVPALDEGRAVARPDVCAGEVGAVLVPALDEGRASPSPTAVGCAPDGVSVLDGVSAVGAVLVPALDGVSAVGAVLVPALDEGRASPSPTAVGCAPDRGVAAGVALTTAARAAPTLSAVVGAFKSLAAHEAGRPLWQRSFHDHVIRDEEDLARLRRYIGENPARWSLDELHPDAPTTP